MAFGKAGGGLPDIERLFIKLILVPLVRVLMTWHIVRILLQREGKIITKLVNSVPHDKLQKEMAIERTFGIEDHSRQFSVNMVLEHLILAGSGIMHVIEELSQEKNVEMEVKIENVKPKENSMDQLEAFLVFSEAYDAFIKNLPKRQSKETKAHPWFVSFNNFDWNIFMFMHTFVHRRQIALIVQTLHTGNSRSNAMGSMIIAGMLIVLLLVGWFAFAALAYFLCGIIFDFSFTLLGAGLTLMGMMVVRMFYPKNVFA